MQPLVYVMAILGCGDDGTMCRNERLEPATYQTAAACQAALPAALLRNSDLSYPVISAACRPRGPQMAQADRSDRQGG